MDAKRRARTKDRNPNRHFSISSALLELAFELVILPQSTSSLPVPTCNAISVRTCISSCRWPDLESMADERWNQR
jgi:hypothetical protein